MMQVNTVGFILTYEFNLIFFLIEVTDLTVLTFLIVPRNKNSSLISAGDKLGV